MQRCGRTRRGGERPSMISAAEALAGDTPRRIFLPGVVRERLASVADRCRGLGGAITVQPCYSVKTDPDRRLLEAARDCSWFAEVISASEHEWTRQNGFADERTIYNGPRPLDTDRPIHAAFADSVEALSRLCERRSARFIGVRVRPPEIPSRFGIRMPDDLDDAVEALKATDEQQRLGVSFHITHSEYERRTWLEIAQAVMDVAAELESRTGRSFEIFDVGGGWTPKLLDLALEQEFPRLLRTLARRLPDVHTVYLEPGQSITRPTQVVVATVLEVRARRNEIVIDAGFADMPQAHDEPPPVMFVLEGELQPAGPGVGRILGPYCVEYDVVATDVEVPRAVRPGDRVVLGDMGAYESSLAFAFARGGAAMSDPIRQG